MAQQRTHAPDALPRILDERSAPDFRDAFGRLARRARLLEVAVTRLRLTTLDLSVGDLAGLERIRVLLAEVRAPLLDAEAHAALRDPGRAVTLRHLIEELRRGRVEVRAAPLGGWSPDFTVFHGASGAMAGLIGPHWLERPCPYRGPAWATVLNAAEARHASLRFNELWARGYDVSPALAGMLGRARRAAEPVPADRGAQGAATDAPQPTNGAAGPGVPGALAAPGFR